MKDALISEPIFIEISLYLLFGIFDAFLTKKLFLEAFYDKWNT